MSRKIFWTDDKIVEALIKWRKINGKWPVCRSWWYSNTDRWPSFMTVCRNGGWTYFLEKAQIKYESK